LLLRSEEFDVSPWVVGRADLEVDEIISPDGNQTAEKFTQQAGETVGGSLGYEFSYVNGTTYTHSIHINRNLDKRWILFNDLASSSVGGLRRTWFDLQTLNVGTTVGSHTVAYEVVNADWIRLSITFTAGNTFNRFFRWGVSDSDNSDTTVDSGSWSFWGAQLEVGSFASTYIPTTTTALTRNADVMTVTGASGVIGQESGWIYAEVDVRDLDVANRQVMSVNNIGIFYQKNGKFAVRSQVADNVSVGLTGIVVRYSNNFQNYTFYVDGEDEGSNTGSALGELNVIGIGIRGNALDLQFNDHILRIALGKGTLTEQQAIEMTTI
jgi:hypothetical protein